MKKFLVLFGMFFLIVPSFAKALIIAPSATIIVIINTISEDNNFSFKLKDAQLFSSTQNFNITTENNTGSYTASVLFPTSAGYDLTENSSDEWKLDNVFCFSNDGGNTTSKIQNGVHLLVSAFSTTTCTFINSKTVSKPPILIVPGIMGTEIYKGAEQLWPDVLRMLNPANSDDFMDSLSFKSDGTALDTSLTLGKVIDAKPKFDYTRKIINNFVDLGYVESIDLFTFPYDWRKDITDIANQNLTGQIDYILNQTHQNKVDIIAHSQGGLVVKKLLLDRPEYQSKINKLVFVGVPNLGAPKAAKVLLYGDNMGISFAAMGLDPEEVRKIGRNMPAIYELLPSPEYFNHANGFLGKAKILSDNQSTLHVTTLNAGETTQYLMSQGLNESLIEKASTFHSADYDNPNFGVNEMRVYNIVGCQEPTLSKILIKPDGSFKLILGPGDGTVPMFSANNIERASTFFALESNHGTMMTQNGIRQHIVNLIASAGLSTEGKITPFSSECHFNGTQVASHSPVILHVYDSQGRHVGPTSDGGFDTQIPGVGYETLGHENFAFLPEGAQYTIKLVATGEGNFNFDSSQIQEGQIINTAYYDEINVAAGSSAKIDLNSSHNQKVFLDRDGDGNTDSVIPPSSILDAYQSEDLTSPLTNVNIQGEQGQSLFFRSNAEISLSATDPVHANENIASGILKTQYKLDGSNYFIYDTPLNITTEGQHTLKFFSTDRAGNKEPEKTIIFTIDKTAPEFIAQFDPTIRDLKFVGADNLSNIANIIVVDQDDTITLSDQANNKTVIKLKDKNRKSSMKAEIQALSYNGQFVDLSKNIFRFGWLFNEKGTLSSLAQQIQAKNAFNILGLYGLNKTLLTGRDKNGAFVKTLNGLVLLKVSTNKGDFFWSY